MADIYFKACSSDNCENNAHHKVGGALGMCRSHYKKSRRSVRVPAVMAWTQEHVTYSGDECLIWPFSRNPYGYGHMRFGGKTRLAHQVMCLLAHGEAPFDKAEAAHSCGKGHEGCVNPRHLRWDTRSGNFSDKLAHGTDNRGEKSPVSKLTEKDVEYIRSMRGLVSQPVLAERFGIHQSCVSKIQSGKSWAWMP